MLAEPLHPAVALEHLEPAMEQLGGALLPGRTRDERILSYGKHESPIFNECGWVTGPDLASAALAVGLAPFALYAAVGMVAAKQALEKQKEKEQD